MQKASPMQKSKFCLSAGQLSIDMSARQISLLLVLLVVFTRYWTLPASTHAPLSSSESIVKDAIEVGKHGKTPSTLT